MQWGLEACDCFYTCNQQPIVYAITRITTETPFSSTRSWISDAIYNKRNPPDLDSTKIDSFLRKMIPDLDCCSAPTH